MSLPTIRETVVETRPSFRIPFWSWWLVALLPIVFELSQSLHHLKLSWDDAAITAAFSRTWAQTGKIALTPVSQVVEGFSSVLWFLLLSIPYFFTHNPDAGLIWMKSLSGIFLLLSLRLLYLIAWQQFENRNAATISVLLLAFCYTPTQEMQNGMEMNLAMFLLLSLFRVLSRNDAKRRVLNASILTVLLLLTRFEMPFTLGLLFLGFFYAAYQNKPNAIGFRDLLKIVSAAVLGFAVIELWRHQLFGEWMPNTVYAKRFIPYSDWSTVAKFLTTRRKAMLEPIFVLPVPIGIAACALICGVSLKRVSKINFGRIHPGIWILALGCFLFGAIFGRNWGIPGRMVAAMLPFLILAIVEVCVTVIPIKHFFEFSVLLLSFQGFVWLAQEIQNPYGNVSLKHVEALGVSVDSVRAALQQDRIMVMTADLGGSSLCCERLDVLDSGLLANPTLARTGWKGFPSYFREARPDIVEIGSPWSDVSHIYDQGLLDDYSIVTANGFRFFLRNDLFSKLADKHAGPVLPVAQVPACMALYPWNSKEDTRFSLSKGTCLVLNPSPASRQTAYPIGAGSE